MLCWQMLGAATAATALGTKSGTRQGRRRPQGLRVALGRGDGGLRVQGWHPAGAATASGTKGGTRQGRRRPRRKRHTKLGPFPNRLAATLIALRAYFTHSTYVFKAQLHRKEGNRRYKSLLRAVNIDHVVKNWTFQFAFYHPLAKQGGRRTPKG